MSHDDSFTLDLFGNTSLSSGFSLGSPSLALDFGLEDDDDHTPAPPSHAPMAKPTPPPARPRMRERIDFRLAGTRDLASTWRQRAADNIAAILTASEIERQPRFARPQEQEKLIRFTGFGASDLANGMFRRPGEDSFRKGWEDLGGNLQSAVTEADYASLARCTQYAHFTPEFIVRAIWAGLIRLGFIGGRILEPGIGVGIFPALMPEAISKVSHFTGIELDPVSARIARLLQPRAKIVNGDLPAQSCRRISTSPSAIRPFRTGRFAAIVPSDHMPSGCMTTSSSRRSIV